MYAHTRNEHVRNVAIIAHVDHGKTTLVDAMFRQSGIYRSGQATVDRAMDRMDLERERGITIAAKNCAIRWRGVKINIVDTPGHADFGGEVERALSMVDGAILLVDAAEGPLPQTRFVLAKALELELKIVLVINKIDRSDARPAQTADDVLELLLELDAHEDHLEPPTLYAIGREGVARAAPNGGEQNLDLLLDTIVREVPGPAVSGAPDAPFQMLVSDLGYADHLGRLAIGKIYRGGVASNDQLMRLGAADSQPLRVTRIQLYEGPALVTADAVAAGDIVVLAGVDDVQIGDTIGTSADTAPLPRIQVDQPTVAMRFAKNTSPLAGREGKIVQASKIRERLHRETLQNVSIQIEDAADDSIIVKGRGEFQLAILIETMRREGFELCVGRTRVIFHQDANGKRTEPIEEVTIDCEDAYTGLVTEKLSRRKARLLDIKHHASGRVELHFRVPTRGLIGYRDEMLTDTRGTGIMHARVVGYEPYQGDFVARPTGSLVADRTGAAVPYAIYNLEPRGRMFVVPGDPVYEGMLVGEHTRDNDLDVNPCKTKKLSNVRAAGKDDAVTLTPVTPLTLEAALQFIRDDEVVEATPKSLRMRKAIFSAQERRTAARR
ncbi:MAG: translational GTPase TypA [Spirochaetaceae bacterium]|nr:translational GTPase TypA [Spirochaetaceae bacterium]